jgi:hypothetical protein
MSGPDVLVAIDRAFSEFGKSVRHAIYYQLSKQGGLDPSDFLTKPRSLSKSLEAIFGSGARTVEKIVVREINAEFDLNAGTLEDALAQVRELTIIHPYPSESR